MSKDKAMHINDLYSVKLCRQVFEVPYEGKLWGQSHGMMTPKFVEGHLGDGLQFLGLSTINDRPHCWVIRIDSGWNIDDELDGDNIHDYLDDILLTIEEECGEGGEYRYCQDCPEYECVCPENIFPAIDDSNGTHWWKESFRKSFSNFLKDKPNDQ